MRRLLPIAKIEKLASGKGRGGSIGTKEGRTLAQIRWKDTPRCDCGATTRRRMLLHHHKCFAR